MQVRYCFDEIIITIDPPHGGKTYGPSYLPMEHTATFVASEEGERLYEHAVHTAKLLRRYMSMHCPHRAHACVHVIDYDSPHVRALLHTAFDTDGEPGVPGSAWGADNPPAEFRPYPFARMWKNSFMYMYAVNVTRSAFLFHSDSDVWPLEKNPRNHGNHHFIVDAVRAFQNHPNIVFVNAPVCRATQWPTDNCDSGGCAAIGTDLTVVWRKGGNAPGPYVSTQLFVAQPTRVKALWPLPWWTDMIEVILIKHLGQKRQLYAYLNGDKSHVCR